MENASLKNCNFKDPAGSKANMEGVNLKGANLEGSDMGGVNLRVATLKNANLQNCDLRTAVLAGADLEVHYQNKNDCDAYVIVIYIFRNVIYLGAIFRRQISEEQI